MGFWKWIQATCCEQYNLENMRARLMAIPLLFQKFGQNSTNLEGLSSNEEYICIIAP